MQNYTNQMNPNIYNFQPDMVEWSLDSKKKHWNSPLNYLEIMNSVNHESPLQRHPTSEEP